jgi:RNA polymerase-binding transcription factor DksA
VDPSEARRRLDEERAALEDTIASMTSDLGDMAAASAGSNLDDEHDPEGATVAFERQQLAALLARAEQQLVEVAAALVRLADGTYGRCEHCGRLIADARLEALPAARICIICADAARSTPR